MLSDAPLNLRVKAFSDDFIVDNAACDIGGDHDFADLVEDYELAPDLTPVGRGRGFRKNIVRHFQQI